MMSQFQPTENILGGRYKIVSELGSGAFGQTFLASDLHLPDHPQCVVKQLQPLARDADSLSMARRLFDTEARVLYQLGNHEQIPRLLAHFEDNQEFYLAQELIEGSPLTQELVAGHSWPEVQVVTLLQDILQVLAFVHQQQVIHRDLKPPNLIRRRHDGRIVLIDFGAVKQVSTHAINANAELTDLTISIGTKGYMPNEQLAGNPRFSSDVYAVGMLGIQALTGVPPKRLDKDTQTAEILWRDRALDVNSELVNVLDQMVRYDFRDRYPTASEALEALRSLPAALLEVSLPQLAPVMAEMTTAAAPTQQAPPPNATEPTVSGTELEPTHAWVLTSAQPLANSTEIVEPLDPSQQVQPTAAPTSATSNLTRSRFAKPWFILAVFIAVGGTWSVFQTGRSLQPAHQTTNKTTNPSSAPLKSPTPHPATSASPRPPTPLPKPPQAKDLLREAERLRQAGQYQKALPLYTQALAHQPDMAEAYWGRCYSLDELRQPDRAIAACDDALNLNSNYAEALWSKGNALDQQKQTLEALALYERATRIKPDFAAAWVDRGVALQSFGRSSEALDALDKAIALNRNSAVAWRTRGAAFYNLGRLDEAIAALDKALELEPGNQDAVKLRAEARKELG